MVVSRRPRRVLAVIAPIAAVVAALVARDHVGAFTHLAVIVHPFLNKWW